MPASPECDRRCHSGDASASNQNSHGTFRAASVIVSMERAAPENGRVPRSWD